MIHNIGPRIFDNVFLNKKANASDLFLTYREDTVLVREDKDKLWYPAFSDFGTEYPHLIDKAKFLFTIDEINYYLVDKDDVNPIEGWTFVSTKKFRTETKYWRSFAGAIGWQLNRWYDNHIFCSRCGMTTTPSDKERMLFCESCGFSVYPTISPCVIVGVYDKDRILLTKYQGRDFKDYALIAGFVEIGESLEDAVHREVKEEVGLSVKNLKFYKSQPWPFSDTILAGFFAELDGDDKVKIQEDELALGEWTNRDDIPTEDLKISLTAEMKEAFRTGSFNL